MKIFGLFKLARVLRVGVIISKLNIDAGTKSLLNIAKLLFYMTLWLHCVGCFNWIAIKVNADVVIDGVEMKWYPPLDWVNFVDCRLYAEDYGFTMVFITNFYYAVLILGSNELGPVNAIEMGWHVASLLLSTLLNVFVLGDVVSLVTSLE